ncbi:MAG: nuclear transport factor 2 family protein [Ilumatobacteraceae bacterium]
MRQVAIGEEVVLGAPHRSSQSLLDPRRAVTQIPFSTLFPMEPWEVEARLEIKDILVRYTHSGDSARLEEFANVFTPDGVLEVVGSRTMEGRDGIIEGMSGTPGRVRQAMERPMSRHFVTNTLYEFGSPESAMVSSYFLNLSSVGVDHWGRYRTKVVKTSEGWRIAHRLVRIDGRVEGSWAPPPPAPRR